MNNIFTPITYCILMTSCSISQQYEDMSASSLFNNALDSRIQVGEICRDFLANKLSEAETVHRLDEQRHKLIKIKPYLDKEIELLRNSSHFRKMCFKSKVYSYMCTHMLPLMTGHQAQEKLHLKEHSNTAISEALSQYDAVLPNNYINLINSEISSKENQIQTKFEQAIIDADLNTVQQMMKAKGNDFTTTDDKTIERYLVRAVKSDSPAMLRLFLKTEHNVNDTIGIYEKTLLMIAAEEGKAQIVHYLLSHGARKSIDQFNKLGTTALMEAAYNGHPNIISQLLIHGANINASNEFDETALEKAVSYGKISSVSLLLNHRKSIKRFNERLQECILIAKELNYKEITNILLKYQ